MLSFTDTYVYGGNHLSKVRTPENLTFFLYFAYKYFFAIGSLHLLLLFFSVPDPNEKPKLQTGTCDQNLHFKLIRAISDAK